jgi:hypothetical protein
MAQTRASRSWAFLTDGSLPSPLIFCVFVEVLLNRADVLVWEYPWWNFPNVGLIVLFGYLPFMVVAFWVFDMEKIRSKIAAVSAIFAVDFTAIILFAGLLDWI